MATYWRYDRPYPDVVKYNYFNNFGVSANYETKHNALSYTTSPDFWDTPGPPGVFMDRMQQLVAMLYPVFAVKYIQPTGAAPPAWSGTGYGRAVFGG